MRLRFEDDDLRRLYEDRGQRSKALHPDIVRSLRKKIVVLEDAIDRRDLYRVKALRLEKLKGSLDGKHSIRLNDQWRLILRFEEEAQGETVVLVGVTDYH